MNCKISIRKAVTSCFFLLLFAVTPGFGKLNLENDNEEKTGGWNRLTDETILKVKTANYGFELHCAEAPTKEVDVHMEKNIGLVSTEFIE